MAYKLKLNVPKAPMFDTDTARKLFMRNMAVAVEEVLQVLTREIQITAPRGVSGELAASFLPELIRRADAIEGRVGTNVEYFLPVELGSKPHFVPFQPIDPLMLWAERKLGLSGIDAQRVGWMIRWKILKKGTKGKFFVEKAYKTVLPRIKRIMARMGVEVAEELVQEE